MLQTLHRKIHHHNLCRQATDDGTCAFATDSHIQTLLIPQIITSITSITANQAGNSQYHPASPLTVAITILSQGTTQTINFPAIANQVYGGPALTVAALNATASSSLPVAITVSVRPTPY
jgi:hypothetical protein